MFHQAARAIIERCSDGLLTAMSRKTPTGIKKLRNIGSLSFFWNKTQLERLGSAYRKQTIDTFNSPTITRTICVRRLLCILTSFEAGGLLLAPSIPWKGVFIFNPGVAHVCLGLANVGPGSKNRTLPACVWNLWTWPGPISRKPRDAGHLPICSLR